MNAMNQDIWDNYDHPAVKEGIGVSVGLIDAAAANFADQLGRHGHAHVVLEPDDGTRYEMIAVRTMATSAPFLFASSFGAAYPWNGTPTIHPDYAIKHYVNDGNTWTAVVFALFLNSAAERASFSFAETGVIV